MSLCEKFAFRVFQKGFLIEDEVRFFFFLNLMISLQRQQDKGWLNGPNTGLSPWRLRLESSCGLFCR